MLRLFAKLLPTECLSRIIYLILMNAYSDQQNSQKSQKILGVPSSMLGALVIAEARKPPIQVLRAQETCRHFLRFSSRHEDHPIKSKLTQSCCSVCYVLRALRVQLLKNAIRYAQTKIVPVGRLTTPSVILKFLT